MSLYKVKYREDESDVVNDLVESIQRIAQKGNKRKILSGVGGIIMSTFQKSVVGVCFWLWSDSAIIMTKNREDFKLAIRKFI